jgi:ribosomal protein S18 acetylase RimI-like enzyme
MQTEREAALSIANIADTQLPAAGALLGRAYRDNPVNVALYGDDPEVRRRTNETIFTIRIANQDPPPLVASGDNGFLGVCGFNRPGSPPMPDEGRIKIMQTIQDLGPDVMDRFRGMLAEWAKRTPAEPHWNLGPVGVAVAQQGRGIGTAMLERFCAMVDEEGSPAFLETDTEANVRLYERFGFETIEHAPVLGIPMWFMWRGS